MKDKSLLKIEEGGACCFCGSKDESVNQEVLGTCRIARNGYCGLTDA